MNVATPATTAAAHGEASAEEQDALRETVRRLLADVASSARVRQVMASATGFDADAWAKLAALGLCGIAIPEAHGGAGYTAVELAIVLEEMGRCVLPGPFLAGAVAAAALLACDGGHELLPGIAEGTTLATFTSAGGVRADTRHRLDGRADHVLDGHIADVVLVAAQTDDGERVFQVDADALSITPLTTMDQTRRLASLTFDGTPATPIGGPPAVTAALDFAATALAAEQVGGAARCLESAVEYAKVRVQFGRPIGSFQAIKHRCADLLVEVESARSAARYAARLAAEASSETGVYAALAKAYCSEVYTRVAAETIQLHGGIGFTWEHDAHLHLKRAKSGEVLFGSPAHHRARLAAHVL